MHALSAEAATLKQSVCKPMRSGILRAVTRSVCLRLLCTNLPAGLCYKHAAILLFSARVHWGLGVLKLVAFPCCHQQDRSFCRTKAVWICHDHLMRAACVHALAWETYMPKWSYQLLSSPRMLEAGLMELPVLRQARVH